MSLEMFLLKDEMETEETHLILGYVEVLREKRGYVRTVQVAVSKKAWFESIFAELLWFCLPSKKSPKSFFHYWPIGMSATKRLFKLNVLHYDYHTIITFPRAPSTSTYSVPSRSIYVWVPQVCLFSNLACKKIWIKWSCFCSRYLSP